MHLPQGHTRPRRDPAVADPVLDARPPWHRSEDGLRSPAVRDAQDFASFGPVQVLGEVLFQLPNPDISHGDTLSQGCVYLARRTEAGLGHRPFAARFVASGAPSMAGDPEAVRFYAHWMRRTGTAHAAAAHNRAWAKLDLHRGAEWDESSYGPVVAAIRDVEQTSRSPEWPSEPPTAGSGRSRLNI